MTVDSGRVCDECGDSPGTCLLVLDDESMWVCDTCFGWWTSHAPRWEP